MFFGFKNKGLKAIYTMHSMDGFVFSLIGIFIPIYLLKLDYPLTSVLIFFIIHSLALAVFSFLAGYIASKIGLKKTIILRFPFLFTQLVLLYFLNKLATPLSVIAILGGLQAAFYWTPVNILFARSSQKTKLGSSIGKFFAFPQLAGMTGPLLGGFIAALFGFKALFFIAFLISLTSIIPLFKAETIKTHFAFKFKKGIEFYKKYPKYFFSEIADNIGGECESIIWPIFIFLSIASVVSVGLVGALVALGSVVFTLIIGELSDKHNKKRFIKIGAILLLSVWLIRYFTDNEILFYLTTILSGFFLALLLVPYTSLLFSAAKKETTDEFFVFKEVPMAVGRILLFSVALLLVSNIKLLFPIAGVAYLCFLFL